MIPKPPPPPPHRTTPNKASRWTCKTVNSVSTPMATDYVPAWVEVLRECGYPASVYVLDFESFFDVGYGPRVMSTPEYIQDKRWEVLGLAHLAMHSTSPFAEPIGNFEIGEQDTSNYLRYLQSVHGPDLSKITVSFHNASFDAMVLSLRYGIHPKYIVDTRSLAAAWNARAKTGLKDQAKVWGLPDKGETKEFQGCTLRRGRYVLSKGRKSKPPTPVPIMDGNQQEALAHYACNDVSRQWELFTILLPRLSNPKVELRVQQHTLELFTKPVLRVDRVWGEDLIVRMQAKMGAAVPEGLTDKAITGNNSFDSLLTTALEEAGDLPMKYTKVMKTGIQFGLAKDDPERKLLESHPSETVRDLIEARSALKSWPLHVARVEKILAMAAVCGDLMPIPLNYWGAHTGRWAGAQRVNLHNLPKRGEPEVVAIRGLLVAPPGHKLVIVDLSAIEARVLPWIAGQDDLVQKFANKEEIYCGFAAKVLGWAVRKPIKEGKPGYIEAVEDRHTWARNNIGKIGILGCGYGMGPKEPGSPDKPNYYFAGAGLDLDMAERIVSVYRESNTSITGFWRAIEKAFIYTAKYHRPCCLERGIRFDHTDEIDVICTLPNGRELHYHKVKLTPGKYNDQPAVYNEIEHSWEHLWGGTLTENVVQAMSRDVLIEAALRLEDQGWHTAHHVHDELILCVPTGKEGECLNAAVKELSLTPAWALGLPLGAEGVISERYGLH